MMKNIRSLVLTIITISFYSQLGIAQDVKKPFTVHESFSRTKLFDVRPRDHPLDGRAFLFSPNGKRVLMISGKGNVTNKSYEFKLLKFELEKIRDVLERPGNEWPEPDIVHSAEYDQGAAYFNLWNSAGIKNLRFVKGDDEVIFISAGDNGKYQLFLADLINKNIRQITNHSNNVVDYDIINNEGDLIYTVEATKLEDPHCSRTSYEIGVFPFWRGVCFASGLSWVDTNYAVEPSYDWVDLYRLKIGNNERPVRLHTSIPLSGQLSEIAIHPSGNKALVIFSVGEAPSELSDKYKSSRYFRHMISRRPDYDPDIMSLPVPYRYFAVISLSGPDILEMRDILAEGENVSHDVQWISSNRIFLPEGEYINTKKADTNNTIEMDVATNGFYVDIGDSGYAIRRPENKVNVAKKMEGQTTGQRTRKINDEAQRCIDALYGDDISADGLPACYADDKSSNIRIWKEEKYNKPPIIMVKDLLTHREKPILELNPQYNNVRIGETKLINWVDNNGNNWNGGIVLPPEFKTGRRYPVVVQAEGFDPNHFLIDGVYFATAPHAARALADKNIIVLQIAAPKDPNLHFDRNMAEMAAGVDAVLELLDEQNLIDTSKLGFIGFSSLGRFVFNLTVFPRFRPRAVIIADAASPSPFAYSYFYGTPYPGMVTQERLACDNWPWGEGQKEWIARNPYYHLDKVESAILLHEYSPGLSDWWDVFAGLKRLKKPVEFRQYTAGKHPPLRPDLIIEDQELTVEWFDFWLNGNESNNNEKKEQYKRWREFKALMGEMTDSSDGKMMLSNMKCAESKNIKK